MIGYKFTVTNIASGQSFKINDFVTDPNNFIALQDYPGMDVDIKNAEIQKEGQHGIWDFFSFYGKRLMSFSGVIIGEDTDKVEILKTQMLRILSLPPAPSLTDDGSVLVSWTDASNNNWQIQGKLYSQPRFDRNMRQNYKLDFTFSIKCKNPEIESQEISLHSSVRGWKQGTLMLPTLVPAMFDIAYDKSFIVDNLGAIVSHTIIKLYGETDGVTNPTVRNITTGKFFTVNMTLTNATKYLIIDSKLGTVKDQDGVDKSGLVSLQSEYIKLLPGDNSIVYTSDETPLSSLIEPTAVIETQHRSTII